MNEVKKPGVPQEQTHDQPDCPRCGFHRTIGSPFCANCGKQLLPIAVLKGSADAEAKTEKHREITVELKLEGKDAFMQDMAEVTQTLKEANSELAAVSKAMQETHEKLTEIDIATATPYEIMKQQLRQLRKMSVENQSSAAVLSLTQAMVNVFRAIDDYERPDDFEDED